MRQTGIRYDNETTPHFSLTYGADDGVAQVHEAYIDHGDCPKTLIRTLRVIENIVSIITGQVLAVIHMRM